MIARRLIALPVLALLLMAQGDDSIEPGRWEEQFVPSQVLLDGGLLGADELQRMRQSRARCVSPETAARPIDFLLAKEIDCGAPTVTGGSAHFEAAASCAPTDNSLPKSIAASGRWSRTDYTMHIDAAGPIDGKKLEISADVTGRFIGPCRGDEEKD